MSLRDNPYAPEDQLAKAWSRGYIAGREGMSREAHPYSPLAGRYRRAWGEGWQAGMAAFRLAKVEAAGPLSDGRGSVSRGVL